jgi:peptidylprolyl isomerase
MSGEQGMDKAKMKQYLVPAVGVAAIVVLVGLVIVVSGFDSRKMSDGSSGSADDPKLQEVSKGVKFRDLKEGTGEPCPPNAKVKMHVTGWRTDDFIFQNTREGKNAQGPITFKLQPGPDVIAGWVEGIPGMKVGGIRKLVIAPEKSYGSFGKPPQIPQNATLIFEVELLEFTPGYPPPRSRRSPPPADLSKLSDGTAPGDEDPQLKPIGTGGLKYRDIKVGDGPECPEGAHVVMDYIGWLTNGSRFDSSWNDQRQPLDMALAELIKGWQQGVPGMRVGGIRKLVIPADLAYGSNPRPGIPANSTLVFEIELLGIK